MLRELIRNQSRSVRDEKGQALAEYSLILALIFAACVTALGIMALAIVGGLTDAANMFP